MPAAPWRSIATSIARAALDGISRGQGEMGVDIGASEEVPHEEALAEGTGDEAAGDGGPKKASLPKRAA